ncbi:MAG: dolichol-phosphate mannosyltransferase [Glaciecola sp.]|jgi:dolichol-phosphate mannosyltransferase
MSKTLVIIPTYNEIDNIKDIIDAVFLLDEPFHVLIVDDGSPDGTADVVKKMMKDNSERLFIQERKGKLGLGTAYIHGFNWALPKGYEYIFEMDADFSHNPNDLLLLLKACRKGGADMSIGSRYVTGVNVVNWPMSRVLMSYFASVYVRWITRMPVRDSTAGFKCYTRKVLETIELEKIKFVGYAFQIEMKFTAWKYGFKLTEVPIIFTDRQKGNSKMHSGIFKEAVLGVLQMKIGSWFKKYKR